MTYVLQLSDLHLGAAGGDPEEDLRRAVAAAAALPIDFDAVVVTGDLADDGATYAPAVERLRAFGCPVLAVPGNHDDRDAIGTAFGPPRWAARAGDVRLVGLDTTIPGQDDGELRPDELAWLRDTLAQDAGVPTLLAMHHPPVAVGLRAFDRGRPDGSGLAEVLAGAPQVRRIACGHVHATVATQLGGTPVLVAPPVTRVTSRLDPHTDLYPVGDGTPGFVVHALVGGELLAHVQTVD